MADPRFPELPSDEELGIAGLDDDSAGGAGESGGSDGGGGGGADRSAPGTPLSGRPAWMGVATLMVVLAGVWLSSGARSVPAPQPANAPDSAFASARAMGTIVDLARLPHPPGSPEHERVRGLLVDRLTGLGLAPEVHVHTEVRTPAAEDAPTLAVTVRNVLARRVGTASTGTVLLLAHYDGRTVSRGAGDDATGVAVILESLRALATGPAPRNDLLVLFTDAEELGLHGARAWVREHLDTSDVKLVLNVEMRGAGGPSVMFETGDANGWTIERLATVDPHPFANSLSLEVYRRMPNDTDFSPFRDAGVQGLNFAAVGRGNVYHQAYDDPAHLDEATVQHHGARLLAVLRDVADADLTEVRGAERAYLVLPFVGMLHLEVARMPMVAAVLLAGLVLALIAVRVRGGSLTGVGAGATMALGVIGLAAAGGQAILVGVRARHPESGWLHGATFHVQGWYLAALAAWTFGVASALWGLARRRFEIAPLALGAALPALAVALVLVLAAPGAAPTFAGPAMAALGATLLLALVGPGIAAGPFGWTISAAAALIPLAFLVAPIELVSDAMTFALAPGIGALMGLMLCATAPFFEGTLAPNRWWTPTLALTVTAGLVGAGVQQAPPTAERPAPSTLIYVQDQGSPAGPVDAWWVGAEDGSLEWAAARTGATFDAPFSERVPDAASYGVRPGAPSAPADAFTLAAPAVQILSDTVAGAGRRIVVGIERPRSPERMDVALGAGAGIVALGDVLLPPRGALRPTAISHLGAPSDPLLILELELPLTATSLDLSVQEELQRPREILDPAFFERPATFAPNVRTGSDRAIIRSFHRLLLSTPDDESR